MVQKQLYYEDINEGIEINSLVKEPSTRQLVMWAGATGDYNPLHYDKDFAAQRGYANVIVHGRLKVAFLIQLVTDWIGPKGVLNKVSCQHRGVDFPGQKMKCSGKVTNKYAEDGKNTVECEIWAENPEGVKTVIGSAVITLPSRQK